MKAALALSLLLLLALVTAGCSNVSNTDDRLSVVASFYPLAYFASQIGGEQVAVSNLTPAGVEPHDYELTPQDIATIYDSELLILNGGQLEPWASAVTADLSNQTTVVTSAPDATDPHVWLSPTLAKLQVEKITEGFIQADPNDTATYQANSENLLSRLDQLNQNYSTGLANCAIRTIVTSHAAFGHLASTYGLAQLPIAGLSPEAEPSLTELIDITNFAEQHNVQYIFFESLVSPKLADTIATEIGAQTLVLNPLEGLTAEEVAAGADYFTVMQANLANLRTALQCQ